VSSMLVKLCRFEKRAVNDWSKNSFSQKSCGHIFS